MQLKANNTTKEQLSISIILISLLLCTIANPLFAHSTTEKRLKHSCIHNKIVSNHTLKLISANKNFIKKNSKTKFSQKLKITTNSSGSDFEVQFDWSKASNLGNNDELSYLRNVIFTKISRLLKLIFKVRHEPNFEFDEDYDEGSITCVDGVKFSNLFLKHFDGGLGIIVTFQGTKEDGFLAWSTACALEGESSRPNFGQLNINPAYLDVNNFRALSDTLIHEIFHIMGFSPTLIPFFVDDNLKYVPLSDTVELNNSKSRIVGIKSPTVLSVARKHYNCPYIKSVNLENEGGEGSIGAHWERNILMNEIMTASEISSSRISQFTLAFMQDTGWYNSNFEYAEHFTYWKSVGCKYNFNLDFTELLEKEGSMDNISWMPNECNIAKQSGCFYDYTHQGECHKDSFMGNGNDSRFTSFLEDKYRYYSMPSDSCVNTALFKAKGILKEEYGSSMRCFVGSLNRQGVFQTKKINFHSQGSFCFSSKCISNEDSSPTNQVEISIADNNFYCKAKNQSLKINVDLKEEKSQITGHINCPDPEDFCLHEPKCRADCEIVGRCLHNGNCYKYN